MKTHEFGARVLRWFDAHGRKDLPWQHDTTPYRVWVSEIMLQQTQVATVIGYYARFMQRFPDVQALADAPLDEVLHLWTGLGYYARARNLHRAAQKICDEFGGEFPVDVDAVQELPGIGRSTAAAILALAHGQRHAILDGNVKRVLSRYAALTGWPGQSAVEKKLWVLAEELTPHERVGAYTQAIMDLGATLCTPKNPNCAHCPVNSNCAALRTGEVARYPEPKPRKALPVRTCRMLLITNATGEVLLEQRPPAGIWGGLWSLPECPPDADWQHWCAQQLRLKVQLKNNWDSVRHTFSHFHLDIHPVHAHLIEHPQAIMEAPAQVWYNTSNPDQRGLAAPVKRLLDRLQHEQEGAR